MAEMIKLIRFDYQIDPTERAFAFYNDDTRSLVRFDGREIFDSVRDLEICVSCEVAYYRGEAEENGALDRQLKAGEISSDIRTLGDQMIAMAREAMTKPPLVRDAATVAAELRENAPHLAGHAELLRKAAQMIEESVMIDTNKIHHSINDVIEWADRTRAELSTLDRNQVIERLGIALDDLDGWARTIDAMHAYVEQSKEAAQRSKCTWCNAPAKLGSHAMIAHMYQCEASPLVRLLEGARQMLRDVVTEYDADGVDGRIVEQVRTLLADVDAEIDEKRKLAELELARDGAPVLPDQLPVGKWPEGADPDELRRKLEALHQQPERAIMLDATIIDATITFEGPGMDALRRAFDDVPDKGQVPAGVEYQAQLLLNATRIVLGLDPPTVLEGPGVPELRLAVETLNQSDVAAFPYALQRLVMAAREVLRLCPHRSAYQCAGPCGRYRCMECDAAFNLEPSEVKTAVRTCKDCRGSNDPR